MLISNPAALRQHNERCRAIADQERQLAAKEEARELARATIDDLSVGCVLLGVAKLAVGVLGGCSVASVWATAWARGSKAGCEAAGLAPAAAARRPRAPALHLSDPLPAPPRHATAGPLAAAPEGGGGFRQRHLLPQLPGAWRWVC